MPIRHSVIHKIDKQPDGSPAVLLLGSSEQVESQARDDLMHQFNESYNASAGKGGVAISGRRYGVQPDHILWPEQCRPDPSCVPGPGRCPPHLHGYVLAAGKGLSVPDIELRALHELPEGA